METVVIVIHLMVVLALVIVVLLQRSEGGALGIGGGGGMMSSRGTANLLTRATAILAFAFFVTSIGLTMIAEIKEKPASILDATPAATQEAPAAPEGTGNGILDSLKKQSEQPTGPQVPTAQ